jgi:hypothetical protein
LKHAASTELGTTGAAIAHARSNFFILNAYAQSFALLPQLVILATQRVSPVNQ